MEFETDRFVVRKLQIEDLECFYEMQSNENVMRYIKSPLNYDESKYELQKFIDYYTDDTRYFHLWAIEDKCNQDFLGICGVYHNEAKENEIAYRLKEKYWGKGIGREIARSLFFHCMSSLGMTEIVAFVDEENKGSAKILEHEMTFVERFYSEERKRFSRKYMLSSIG